MRPPPLAVLSLPRLLPSQSLRLSATHALIGASAHFGCLSFHVTIASFISPTVSMILLARCLLLALRAPCSSRFSLQRTSCRARVHVSSGG